MKVGRLTTQWDCSTDQAEQPIPNRSKVFPLVLCVCVAAFLSVEDVLENATASWGKEETQFNKTQLVLALESDPESFDLIEYFII